MTHGRIKQGHIMETAVGRGMAVLERGCFCRPVAESVLENGNGEWEDPGPSDLKGGG